MTNAMRGMTVKEQAKQLKQFGIKETIEEAVQILEELHGSKQDQQMQDLLKSVHYG